MAKINGLGVRLYAAGYDLNTDVSALTNLGYEQELLDVTALADSARSRIVGVADGRVTVNGWFDAASGHAAWTSNTGKLPTADQDVVIGFGTSLGDSMAAFTAKEASYNVNRAPGAAIATTVSYQSTGATGIDYGVLLTTGPKQTDASAANSNSVDNANSSANGATGWLQVVSLGSGTATVKIQHSTNNSTWADLITFAAATGQTSERVAVTGTVNRYTRVISTGTFTNLVFVAGICRL